MMPGTDLHGISLVNTNPAVVIARGEPARQPTASPQDCECGDCKQQEFRVGLSMINREHCQRAASEAITSHAREGEDYSKSSQAQNQKDYATENT